MEQDPAIAELAQRIASLEAELRQRISTLEHRVDGLGSASPATVDAPPIMFDEDFVAEPPSSPSAPPPPTGPPALHMPPPAPPAVPVPAAVAPGPPPPRPDARRLSVPPPAPSVAPPARRTMPSFEVTSERLLRWAGLTLVSLAAIFLVSTAISRGWIGPELQWAGATIGGIGLLATAVKLAGSNRRWSLTFAHGGAVVLAYCASSSWSWLDLVPAGVSLGLSAVVILGTMAVADHIRRQSVAVTAGVFGAFVPATLEVLGELGSSISAVWLVSLVIAAAAIGILRCWSVVRLVVGWLAAFMLLGYLVDFADDTEGILPPAAWAATFLIAAVMWLGPYLAGRFRDARSDRSGPTGPLETGPTVSPSMHAWDHRLVAFVPAWTWACVGALAYLDDSERFGRAGLIVAGVFGVLVAGSWKTIPVRLSSSHFLGASAVFAVGLTLVLGGPALIVALLAQTVISAVISSQFGDRWMQWASVVLGVILLLMTFGEMVDTIASDAISWGEAVAYLLVFAAAAAGTFWIWDEEKFTEFKIAALGVTWTLGMLWLATVILPASDGSAWVLIAWSGTALLLFASGRRFGDLAIKSAGLASLLVAGAGGIGQIAVMLDRWEVMAIPAIATAVTLAIATAINFLASDSMNSEVRNGLFLATWGFGLAWLSSVLLPLDHGPALLTMAWTVAAALGFAGAHKLGESLIKVTGLVTLGVSAALGLGLIAEILDKDSFIALSELATTMIVAAALLVSVLIWDTKTEANKASSDLRNAMFVMTWLFAIAWIAGLIVPLPEGLALLSVGWMVLALGGIVFGLLTREPTIRTMGLLTVGGVIIKLLTVDLAAVDVFVRVGVFLVLGAFLMYVAYLLPKIEAKLQPAPPSGLPLDSPSAAVATTGAPFIAPPMPASPPSPPSPPGEAPLG